MKRFDLQKWSISNDTVRRIFLYAFLFGVIAHGSVMSKAIFWGDGISSAYHVGVNIAVRMGRWMRALLAYIVARAFGGQNPSLPLLYGSVSVLFIAASALVIVRTLQIQKKILQLLLCGMMISFPVVTGTFGYMYTAPYYFLGLFLATLAVLAVRTCKGIAGFLIGAVCVCCSMALYQTYVAVTVSLFVISLIFDIVNDRYPKFSDFLKNAFCYLGVCVAGFVAYMVIWKLCLRFMNLAASDYQGISSLGQKGIASYLHSIVTIYKKFFLIGLNSSDNLYPMGLRKVQIVILAISAAFSVYIVVCRLKKNVLFGIALALLIAMLPVCFNVIYLFGSNKVHTVMLYGQCMLYVYLICLIDHIIRGEAKLGAFCYRLSVAVLLLMVCMNVFFDNGCYLKAEMMTHQNISNMTVLVSRIKSLDGYRDDMPVCIAPLGQRDATITPDDDLSDYTITPYGMLIPYAKRPEMRRIKRMLSRYCGFSPRYINYEKFKNKDAVKQMPDYPDAGSVQIVDGTVVVRM